MPTTLDQLKKVKSNENEGAGREGRGVLDIMKRCEF